jgi:hypothetical protein
MLDYAVLQRFEDEIRMKGFDVFMIDPFVSFHSVLENDNGCMDLLLKEGLGGIASRTNSAGEVFHHPGKPKARTGGDDGRRRPWSVSDHLGGAQRPSSQLHGTRRSTQARHRRGRAATPHSDGERQSQHGPPRQASWFRLEVEKLANGDEIACASPWKPPDPLKGVATADMHKCRELARTGAYRLDSRSTNWVGYMVAEVLKINVSHGAENDRKHIARIKQILRTWLKNKVFATEKRQDENRKKRTFVVPGQWEETPTPEEPVLDE